MATISCTDCGEPRTGVPSNTRYCKKCRQLRDLDHWQHLTRRCACGQSFAPLNRNDIACSSCNTGLRAYSGTCVLSPKDTPHEGRYPTPTLPVCVTCARDPKQRRRLVRALERGQRARAAANAPPQPKETHVAA